MSYSISIPKVMETEVKTDTISITPPKVGEEIWSMEKWHHSLFFTKEQMEDKDFQYECFMKVRDAFMEWLYHNPDFFVVEHQYDAHRNMYEVCTTASIMKRRKDDG